MKLATDSCMGDVLFNAGFSLTNQLTGIVSQSEKVAPLGQAVIKRMQVNVHFGLE